MKVVFNDPTGTRADQYRIVSSLAGLIQDAVPGATVRIVVYSYSLPVLTRQLLAAHKRGVHVQCLFDHHLRSGAGRELQKVLGSDVNAGSFVRFIVGSARGAGGVTHAKIFTVSETHSGQKNVVMVGSANLTQFCAEKQYADVLIAESPLMYQNLSDLFEVQKQDSVQKVTYWHRAVDKFRIQVYPFADATVVTDPVARRLRHLLTHYRGGEIRIAMHAWNGARGLWLADEVIRLHRNGFRVRCLLGKGTGQVVRQRLASAGVPVKTGIWAHGVHIHHKLMIAKVLTQWGGQRHLTWTGSDNWTQDSLKREEIDLRVDDVAIYTAYERHFDALYGDGRPGRS